MFDKTESGLIDGDKLKQIMTTMGETLEEDEMKELMKDANIGADGKIAYEGESHFSRKMRISRVFGKPFCAFHFFAVNVT